MTVLSGNEILRNLLDAEGRTQMEVSETVFGQRNRLSLIFSKDSDIKLSTFAALCDELGYDIKIVKRDITEYTLDTTLKRTANYGNK